MRTTAFGSFRHFHDPLKPLPSAGLFFFGHDTSHQSRWMQRPTDRPEGLPNEWSWRGVPAATSIGALTGSSPALTGTGLWADTFPCHWPVDAPRGRRFGPGAYAQRRPPLRRPVRELRVLGPASAHQGSEGEQAFVAKDLATPQLPAHPTLVEAGRDLRRAGPSLVHASSIRTLLHWH